LISATSLFGDDGRLVNFVTDDRIEINAGVRIRFSTPVQEYTLVNGIEVLRRVRGRIGLIWRLNFVIADPL
jgi:hypothetical protein